MLRVDLVVDWLMILRKEIKQLQDRSNTAPSPEFPAFESWPENKNTQSDAFTLELLQVQRARCMSMFAGREKTKQLFEGISLDCSAAALRLLRFSGS